MRWNAHDPSDELTALLGVDRAGDWTEFRAALAGFQAPEQNWIYADVDGNIGYQMTGAVPVRRSGNGLLPTPGWTDEGEWERYLDFEELPWTLNPPEGFIVTANNRVIGPEYPYFITANWEFPYRAERIRELILRAAGRSPRTTCGGCRWTPWTCSRAGPRRSRRRPPATSAGRTWRARCTSGTG